MKGKSSMITTMEIQMSKVERTEQFRPIKAVTPPRRPAPKLSPGQGVKTVDGHKRGQDKG